MDIKMEQDAPNDLQSAINKNSNEEEMVEDSSRKRSGDCLDEVLPPSLMEKCKAYFCGVCSQKLPSQMISTAHYAGTPHEENITRELVKLGIKSPPKLKKSKKYKTRNHVFCNVCNNFVETEDHLLTSHKLEKAHLKKLEILKLKRDVCNVFLNSDDSPIHQKQLQMIEQNKPSYSCDLCEIMTSDLKGLEMHLQGNSHQKKAKQLSTKQTKVVPEDSSLVEKCTPTFCHVCLISHTSLVVADAHYVGKPHKKKLKKTLEKMSQDCKQLSTGRSSKSTENSSQVKSDVSAISVDSEDGKEWFDQYDKPLPSSFLGKCTPSFCGVCSVTHTSQVVSKAHYIGKVHEKRVKLQLEKIYIGSGEMAPKRINKFDKVLRSDKDLQTDEDFPSILLEKCKPDYCSVCFKTLNKNNSKPHYVGKPHNKEVKKALEQMRQDSIEIDLQQKEAVPDLTSANKWNLQNNKMEHDVSNEALSPPRLCAFFEKNGKCHRENCKFTHKLQEEIDKTVTPEKKEYHSEEKFMEPTKQEEMVDSLASDKELGDICEKNFFSTPPIHTSFTDKSLEKEEVVVLPENFEVNKLSKEDDNLDDAVSSDDDLIILESQDSFPPSNNESIATAPVIESVKLCEYPLGERHNVTVSTQDYASLEHDTFLNDIIIDFYLLYLAKNVLPIEDRENVHIFSTMFYKRLLQSPRKDAKKIPEYETDPTLTPAEIRHFRVAGWTKNVDLFEKDMLIVPICECSHWYLLLIVKPGLIFVQAKKEERMKKGEPFVIVLDSVGGTKNTAVKNIRRYLACEWKKKKCVGENSNEISPNELASSAAQMRTLRPNKPEQENNSDCGIYLLHYVEKVFENVSAFLWKSLVTYRTREWFTIEEVGKKRGEIAELIKALAAEQRPGEEIEYPQIKFTAESLEEGITEEAEAEIGMNTWK